MLTINVKAVFKHLIKFEETKEETSATFTRFQGQQIPCLPGKDLKPNQFAVFIVNLKIYSNQKPHLNRTSSMNNVEKVENMTKAEQDEVGALGPPILFRPKIEVAAADEP